MKKRCQYVVVFVTVFLAFSANTVAQPIKGLSQLRYITSTEKQVEFLLRSNPALTRVRAKNVVTQFNTPSRVNAGAPKAFLPSTTLAAPTFKPIEPLLPRLTEQVIQRANAARSAHTLYGQVHREEYHALMDMHGTAHDLALAFPRWLSKVGTYIMNTPETTQAMEALRYAVASGALDDSLYQVLYHLYSMPLGPQDNGGFLRVAYRGNTPNLPVAKDFHLVVERTGLYKLKVQHVWNLHLPHIAFNTTKQDITGIVLLQGVTPEEVHQVIEALRPQGYAVRMSAHEFGINNDKTTADTIAGKLHLHFEKIPAYTDQKFNKDIVYSININAMPIVRGKSTHQIMHIYRQLFRPYMDENMVCFTL